MDAPTNDPMDVPQMSQECPGGVSVGVPVVSNGCPMDVPTNDPIDAPMGVPWLSHGCPTDTPTNDPIDVPMGALGVSCCGSQ